MLDLPNHRHLTYELGRSPVRVVIKAGRVVWERAGGTDRPGGIPADGRGTSAAGH